MVRINNLLVLLINNMKHRFKKKLGQNFLIDNNIIEKIVNYFEFEQNDLVIEIGAGAGSLTKRLANKANVLAYEIDVELKTQLSELEDKDNVKIIWDDFLKRNVNDDIKDITHKRIFVIANLPYYITTPIIEKIIFENIKLDGMLLMVQKEVGDRFTAEPSSKQYGSLTVFLNYYFKMKEEFIVKKNCFFPIPDVDSVIVSFKTSESKLKVHSEDKLFKLIKDSFKFKRKTLKNNLKEYNLDSIYAVLKKHNMDLSIRAEQIPLDIFIEISNIL